MNDQSPVFNSRIMKIYLEYLGRYHPDLDLDSVLEFVGMTRHDVEDQAHWYSQDQAERFHRIVTEKTGNPDIARQAGRYATSSEGLGFMKQYALGLMSLDSVYLLMERLYSRMSHGATVKVRKLGPQRVEIVATRTPGIHEKRFQCENRMGMFESLAKLFTRQFAKIEHPECFHRGENRCRYIVTWSKAPSLILKRVRNYALALGILALPLLSLALPILPTATVGLLYVFLAGGVSLLAAHVEKRELVRTVQTQGDAAEKAIQELKVRYDHALLVQEVGRITSSIVRTDPMVDAVAGVMERVLDCQRMIILLSHREGTRLRYASGCGISEEQREALGGTELACNPAAKSQLLSSTPGGVTLLFLIDVPGQGPNRLCADIGLGAFLCVPVVYRDEFFGVIGLDAGEAGSPLTKTDLSLMMGISSQIAAGIVNARSFQALKESERNYRELVETARSIILRLDLQGRITFVNEFSQNYLGCNEKELLGKPIEETDLFEEAWHFDEVVDLLLDDSSRHVSFETEIKLWGEDHVWVAWTFLPILDKEGHIKEILYAGNDITKLKRAEIESERAREASEAANRAKDEFLANISHEIRTPLHGVLGMTERLQATPLDTDQQRWVKRLGASGRTLLTSIDAVLDFSSMATDVVGIQSVPFALRRTVEQVVETLAEGANRNGLELVCRVETSLADTFRGDPNRLRQMLNNLVDNAVKFSEQGEVTVRVYTVEESKDKAWVCFEVRDTGIGVSEEMHTAIFEPFTQVDGSTTRDQGGVGLGLTVTKRICERMGGEIHVESVPGRGSTFSFVVPLEKEAEPREDTRGDVGKAAGGRIFEVGESRYAGTTEEETVRWKYDARVLLVEDNPVNQELGVSMLEDLGCRVEVAWNGLEALETISRTRFDLILMDCQMPQMDGYQATGAIRNEEAENGAGPRVPVIALTAHAMEGDRERCLAAGMDDYLPKPFTQDQLKMLLGRWLAKNATMPNVTSETCGQAEEAMSDHGTDQAAIDRKALDTIRSLQREGKPDLLARVINIYLEDSLRLLESLREAVSQGDEENVKRSAHSLKSSSANVGAVRLSTICKDLEKMDAGGAAEQGGEILSKIETEYEGVRSALNRELEIGRDSQAIG